MRAPASGDQGEVFLDTLGGFGGSAAEQNMDVSVGEFEGRWLLFSLTGDVIPAGYFHLTVLEVESIAAQGCIPGTIALKETVVSDKNVSGWGGVGWGGVAWRGVAWRGVAWRLACGLSPVATRMIVCRCS